MADETPWTPVGKEPVDDQGWVPVADPNASWLGTNLEKGWEVGREAVGGVERFLGAESRGLRNIAKARANQARLETDIPSMSWDKDVTGVGSGFRFIAENVVKNAALAVPSIAAGVAAAAAAPALGVAGVVGTGALAATAALAPSLAIETGIISAESEQVEGNRARILKGATPAAALDAASTAVTLGAGGFITKPVAGAVKQSLLRRAAKGAGALVGAGLQEGATEGAQSPLEKWGAGKQVFKDGKSFEDDVVGNTLAALTGTALGAPENYTPEMQAEIRESAIGGAAAGLGMAGGGKAISTVTNKLFAAPLEEVGQDAQDTLETLVTPGNNINTAEQALAHIEEARKVEAELLASTLATQVKEEEETVTPETVTPEPVTPETATPEPFNPLKVSVTPGEALDYQRATGDTAYEVVRKDGKFVFEKTLETLKAEGYATTPSGNPFTSKAAAEKRIDLEQYEAVPFKKGWVGKPKTFLHQADVHAEELAKTLVEGGIAADDPVYAKIINERRTRERVPDPQTGLIAREHHNPTLERAVKEGRDFGYADVDLTNLGGLNEWAGGIEQANPYMRDIAQILVNTVQSAYPTAQVFRKGGDEFGVIAPGTNSKKLDVVLAKAQEAVKAYTISNGLSEIPHTKKGNPSGVGITYGTADTKGKSSTDVLKIADARTAKSKQALKEAYNVDAKLVGAVESEPLEGQTQRVVEGVGQDNSGQREAAAQVKRPEPVTPEPVTPETVSKPEAEAAFNKEYTARFLKGDFAGAFEGHSDDMIDEYAADPANQAVFNMDAEDLAEHLTTLADGVKERASKNVKFAVKGNENVSADKRGLSDGVLRGDADVGTQGTRSVATQGVEKGSPDTVEGRTLVEASIKRSIATHGGTTPEAVQLSLVSNVGDYKVANSIARLFGKYVYTADTAGDASLGDAFVSGGHPDAIFISKNTDKPVLTLLGHELLHKLAAENSELYNKFKLYIEANNKSGVAEKYKAGLKKISQYSTLDDAGITEEYLGNVVGHMFAQQSFWEKLARTEPTLFARILNILRDMLQTIKSNFQGAASTLKDVNEAETVTAKVFAKYARLYSEGKFSVDITNPDIRFSISDKAAQDWGDRDATTRARIVSEYLSGRHAQMPWKVVPAGKLVKIWQDTTKSGFVRDEKGLNEILDQLIENAQRLRFNNEISGHEQFYPDEELYDINEDYPDMSVKAQDKLREKISDWTNTPEGDWRISDYGLPKIQDYLLQALDAKTAEEKLVAIDKALNVVHQRSDLASWFIAGGSKTLSSISGEGMKFSAASEAGATTEGQKERAAKMWAEMGVESPFFKKWFGKSKVVDADGKPLVVYHGTAKGGFTEFVPNHNKKEQLGFGVHFSEDVSFANVYADGGAARKGKTPETYAVYLKIDNMLDADSVVDEGTPEYALAEKLGGARVYKPVNPDSGKRQIYIQNAIDITGPARADKLIREAGYDGVAYKSRILTADVGRYTKGAESKSYVVFSPTQIKSATDNNGEFDITNPDIRFSASEEARPWYSKLENLFTERLKSVKQEKTLPRSHFESILKDKNLKADNFSAGDVGISSAGDVGRFSGGKNVTTNKGVAGDTNFHLRPASERLAAINSTVEYPDGSKIPQGSLKVSKNSTLQNQLSKIAGVFGHDVTLVADFPGRRGDGFWYSADTKHIYIYETSADKPLAVLGHELVHHMQTQDNALYKELGAGFFALRDNAGMNKYLDRYFPGADKSSVPKGITEEWVGDVLGRSMGDQGFWDAFEKASPSLAARVARFIHELIQKVKGKLFSGRIAGSAQTVKDFKAVDKLAADVMTRYASRLEKAAASGEGVKSSAGDVGRFSTSLTDSVKAAKGLNDFFKKIPYSQIATDAANKIYRFVIPVDRQVTLNASQKTYAPIKSLLNQFIRQRKEKAGRIQSDMTNGAHIWKRFEKQFKTDAEVQNFSDMVWNATEYELHADPDIASPWNDASWEKSGMLKKTGKTLGDAQKIVSDQYRKLTPEQKTVHLEMLHHVQQMYQAGRQAELAWLDPAKVKEAEAWLQDEVGNTFNKVEKPELVDLVRDIDEHYPTLRGDYMPMMRFGDLIVRTYETDKNGELGARMRTDFFDSPEDARKFIEAVNSNNTSYQNELKAAGDDAVAQAAVREKYKDYNLKHAKIETNPEYRKDVVNIPASLVDKISKAAANQGITGDALEELKQSIEGIRANLLPKTSTKSSKLHREGVAGYEKDVVRVYLTYVRNHALANAQLTHGAKIEQTFRDMRNKIDAIASEPNYDVDAVRRMGELADHLYGIEKAGSREKVNEFTKTVGKITFAWYLSSPSTFAVQWSQPFMVTIPKMGARHGFGKAFAAYTKAAKQYLHGEFSDDKIDEFDRKHEYVGQRVTDILDQARDARGDKRVQLDKELKEIYNSFEGAEKRLLILKVLSHQGQIDLAMSHNAADVVAGATADTKALNWIVDKGAFFMQKSETGSRRAAAISAFELQFNGNNFTEANDYATHIISDTLMDFDAQNRGAAWRGNTGRIIGQFQFFRMHMVGKLAQLTKDAIGGEYKRAMAEATTQEEKDAALKAMKEARYEFAYVMGSSFALAGAMGTPLAVLMGNTGMSAIWAALAAVFGDDDDPWDPKRDFELAVREALGDTAGNVVLKGLPSLVGADISRRIGLGGMGDIIQGDPPAGLTPTAKANWYAGRILGPSWGIVSDTIRSADALADGDLAGAFRAGSPKIMRDVAKMFSTASEGVEAGGKTILKPEDVSVWSMALMFSGINPMEVALAGEESRYLKNISTELSQRRSLLIKHLAEATVDQDLDAKEAAIEKINKFSETQPMLKITQQELVRKIKKIRDGREGKLSKRETLIQDEFGKK